ARDQWAVRPGDAHAFLPAGKRPGLAVRSRLRARRLSVPSVAEPRRQTGRTPTGAAPAAAPAQPRSEFADRFDPALSFLDRPKGSWPWGISLGEGLLVIGLDVEVQIETRVVDFQARHRARVPHKEVLEVVAARGLQLRKDVRRQDHRMPAVS